MVAVVTDPRIDKLPIRITHTDSYSTRNRTHIKVTALTELIVVQLRELFYVNTLLRCY
jgi:hypothetical protein